MRENGGSLDLNFISLLNPAVDELNWVGWHQLLQFILGKWCCVRCSNLFKLLVNGKYTKHFPFFCAWIDLPFIIFVCSLYRPWVTIRLLHHFGFVCVLILGYAVCIFHATYLVTDAKYVMFHVGWRKSLKGNTTPATSLKESLIPCGCTHITCTTLLLASWKTHFTTNALLMKGESSVTSYSTVLTFKSVKYTG